MGRGFLYNIETVQAASGHLGKFVSALPRSLLEKELESVGIRLNKHKPNIYFKVRPLSPSGCSVGGLGLGQSTAEAHGAIAANFLSASLPLSSSSPRKVAASPLTQQSH